jgi:hypothetical protein
MQCNFLGGRGPECSGIVTEYSLYKSMGDIDMRTEFELLKVKVPIVFSAQWVSRHPGKGRWLAYRSLE